MKWSAFSPRVRQIRGFNPRLGQNKDYQMRYAASQLSMQHKGISTKTAWLGIMKLCPSVATFIPVDYHISELAL